MIYLVTNQTSLIDSNRYKVITVEESLRILEPLKIVGTDTETEGLDPHTGKLLSLQLGCKKFQVVVDCLTVNILLYKDFLESDRLFLFWNAKFDLKWLYKYGIVPKKVYDGYLGEKLLWLGYPIVLSVEMWNRIKCSRYDYVPPKGTKKPYYIIYMNLKKAGEMYLGIELDKSIRGQIIYKGIYDEEVIEYAALDVKYLEDIREKQLIELEKNNLLRAMDCECRFILSLAYMEFCGVRIDIDRWKKKMANDNKQLEEIIEKMNQWLVENDQHSKYIYINTQGDLFAENHYDLTPKVSINWNSTKQVIPVFKKFGVHVEIEDNGENKDSINEKVLAPQKDKCSLIPLYLEYKGLMKLTSTYGQNFLDQINPTTGRIHTNFNSVGTDTARISSGGKDKINKIDYINFLNIPADAETRACFVANDGNLWISIDYSGQESFIMGDMADDKAILHELNYGDKDLHTLTAKIIYDYIPKDMPAKEVKKKFHNERNLSKRYEFAFNYAGNQSTIKRNFGLTDEEANRIYNAYMSGFDGLKKYQEFRKKDWFEKGYIELNPKIGYRAYIYDYYYLKELQSSFREEGFWDNYRVLKKTDPNNPIVLKVKEFFKRKADSDRQSVNYPIQNCGALCYKTSMINFFEYLRKNNLLFKVLITVTPYDEINCEAPESIAEDISSALYNIMVEAGKFFVKKCKLDAEVSRLEDGSLPSYWVH